MKQMNQVLESRYRRLLTVAIVGAILVFKWIYNSRASYLGIDGSFYANIARNIRDGNGFVTDISLYHQGYPFLPYHTTVYPIWPLVLGYVSQIMPLEKAAIWLPTLFYLLTLIVAYHWALRTSPDPLLPELIPGLNAGHLMLIMLGLNDHFLIHTSRPYTEGLAFFVLFLVLERSRAIFESPTMLRAFEVGLLLGVLILIRSQMVIAGIALIPVFLWTLILRPRQQIPAGLSLILGTVIALMPQLWHFSTFIDSVQPSLLFRFDQFRATSTLSIVPILMPTEGAWDFILDRARGFRLAFLRPSDYSYYHSFFEFFLAPGLALPLLFVDAGVFLRRNGFSPWIHWSLQPVNHYRLFLGLFAVGGFLSLHTIHKATFTEWNFGMRHALTALFFFFGLTLYLFRRPQIGKIFATYLLCVALFQSLDQMQRRIADQSEQETFWGRKRMADLLFWLKQHAPADKPYHIAMTQGHAQNLAMLTQHMGIHWIYRGTTLEDMIALTDVFQVTYVITLKDSEGYAFLRDEEKLETYFRLEKESISGFDIYARK